MEKTELADQSKATAQDDKKNWAELTDSESEEETQQKTQKSDNPITRSQKKQAAKPNEKVGGSALNQVKQQQADKKKPSTKAESTVTRNMFECEALEAEDDEEEFEEPEEKPKETVSLKELLASQKAQALAQEKKAGLSKKEQKKKELEELEKVLSELGLQEANAKAAEQQQQESAQAESSKNEGEENAEDKKKKKKKKKTEGTQPVPEESKAEETQPATTSTTENKTPVDVEKAIQEAMKKRLKKEPQKKGGLNLEAAKQEVLNRKNQLKKKEKKVYEDL